MYLEHFQLKNQPFAEHAAVSSLWQDQRMDEGLARLDYLVHSGQLGLVTGPSGVGKSALLKRFLHGLLPPHCQEYLSAVNPRTNLGRCFYCLRNFNPIEFTMAVQQCDFVAAVHYLEPLLRASQSRHAGH